MVLISSSPLTVLAMVLAVLAVPAAPADNVAFASIIDHGLGDSYHPGDIATGYLVVANDGDAVISSITVTVTIYPDSLLGFPAGYQTMTFDVGLAPGDSKRIEYSREIPESLLGMSTIGHYRLEACIGADGTHVATIDQSLNVVPA